MLCRSSDCQHKFYRDLANEVDVRITDRCLQQDLPCIHHNVYHVSASLPHWSRLPCGLRRRSAAFCFLGSRVRIPLKVWVLICCGCLCCVGSGLCNELITRPEKSFRACVCVCVCVLRWVCSKDLKIEPAYVRFELLRHRKINLYLQA